MYKLILFFDSNSITLKHVRLSSSASSIISSSNSKFNLFPERKYKAIIYRIIGNDLPPRHSPLQSLINLKFILRYETEFQDVKKVWVLNRIVDLKKQEALISILKQYNKQYLIIPFDINEYKSIPLDYSAFPMDDYFYSEQFESLASYGKYSAIDQLYHRKNLYVMNNNGARNFALQDGKKYADWVFPLDGNLFFTDNAWNNISFCTNHYNISVIQIPMVRLVDNYDALEKSFYPLLIEEPQLAFAKISNVSFNPAFRYGRRSKIELLWRLNIPGPWNNSKKFLPWEKPYEERSEPEATSMPCGWVARLFSGKHEQEWKDARASRNHHRILGIHTLIDSLDTKLIASKIDSKSIFMFLPRPILDYIKSLSNSTHPHSITLQKWVKASTTFLKLHPVKDIQYKASEIFSMSKKKTQKKLKHFQKRIYLDSILYYITDSNYAAYEAYQMVWNWLLSIETLKKQSYNSFEKFFILKGSNWANITDIHKSLDLVFLFDALSILEETSMINFYDYTTLKIWAQELSRKILEFDYQRSTIKERNHRDIQISASCIFSKDYICVYHSINRFAQRSKKSSQVKSNDLLTAIGLNILQKISFECQQTFTIKKVKSSPGDIQLEFTEYIVEFLLDLVNKKNNQFLAVDLLLSKIAKFSSAEAYKIIQNILTM